MTPEEQAREEIDAQLTATGWVVQTKPMAAGYYAIQAVMRGQVEGDAKKFVPKIAKEIAVLLPNLAASEKLSSKL